jgi:hypothetical protein
MGMLAYVALAGACAVMILTPLALRFVPAKLEQEGSTAADE